MSTPTKSPQHKRAKGDELQVPTDDVGDDGPTAGSSNDQLLRAMSHMLDEKLDTKFNQVQDSFKAITKDLEAFKVSVRSEFVAMGLEVAKIDESCNANTAKITQLEKDMLRLKVSPPACSSPPVPSRQFNVVIGNIPEATSFETAKSWITTQASSWNINIPAEHVFTKSSYTGILFVKARSIEERDTIITNITNMAKLGKDAWKTNVFAKVDLPIDERTVRSTLFAIRRMLVDWGYHKSAIKVDTDQATVEIQGKPIVHISVVNYELQVEWCDGEWERWEDLQNASDLTSIKSKAHDQLSKAKDLASNKGKGKSASSGA